MNQFRRNNRPTLLDWLWSTYSYLKYRKHVSIFFEFGSYLYRYYKNVVVDTNVYFKRNSIVGCANKNSYISIGKNTTIGFNTIIISSEKIDIGSNCMIAPNVYIGDSNHGMSPKLPFNQQDNVVSPILIEDNVWIGAHSLILPGVKVVAGTIVGANSTVTNSILEQGVYVGSPAKRIK
jgi:acetyltransferase-like isoleucine patch superfamily enzyme